jgi:hypothetical protein
VLFVVQLIGISSPSVAYEAFLLSSSWIEDP